MERQIKKYYQLNVSEAKKVRRFRFAYDVYQPQGCESLGHSPYWWCSTDLLINMTTYFWQQYGSRLHFVDKRATVHVSTKDLKIKPI